MILMAFFTKMPIILTEDTDIDKLRAIAKRKMKSESYALDIHSTVDILIMLAEKEDSVFSKNELVDIVKSIGEKRHQSDIKQAWNRTHLGT